jgi:hypothetical protein
MRPSTSAVMHHILTLLFEVILTLYNVQVASDIHLATGACTKSVHWAHRWEVDQEVQGVLPLVEPVHQGLSGGPVTRDCSGMLYPGGIVQGRGG